jgi:glycosyltransferase involved in cell wall biosynthesis
MYAGWSARIATTKPLIVSFMGNDVIGDSNERGEYSFWNVFFHRSLSIILANTVELSIVKSKQIGGLIRTDRKIVIPNGVDLGFFAPQKVSRSKLGLDSRRFYVLFSGRKTDPVKQYRLAELAVEELISRGVNAELIGLEGKSSAVVRDYLNAVDCLLVTSTHEGSPNSVKEAMACNLPIVSVDVGDVAERIIGADLCFVVNRDVPAIAAGLMKVREGRRKSSNARKLVEPLEIDKISRDIADVYSRVLKGN